MIWLMCNRISPRFIHFWWTSEDSKVKARVCLKTWMNPSSLSRSRTLSLYHSLCFSLFICLSLTLCLFVSLSICLSLYLYICLSIYIFVSLSVCLYLSLSFSLCLSVGLSLSVFVSLSVYLSRSVCLSMCLSLCSTCCLLTGPRRDSCSWQTVTWAVWSPRWTNYWAGFVTSVEKWSGEGRDYVWAWVVMSLNEQAP